MEARRKPSNYDQARDQAHDVPAHPSHPPQETEGRQGAQLRLLNGDQRQGDTATWRLDPVTRERGLEGVQRARRVLEEAHPPAERERRWPQAS